MYSLHSMITKFSGFAKDPVNAYQLYQAGRYLTSILVSIILVQSGLDSDGVGHFELLLFIAVTFSFFWTVGIQNALVSYYPNLREEEKLKTLQTVFLLFLFLGSLVGLMIILFPQWVINIFRPSDNIDFLPLVALFVLISSPLLMIENILLLRKKADLLIRYAILSLAGVLILTGLIGFFLPKPENFIIVIITIAAFRLIYLIYLLELFKKICFDKKVLYTFIIFALPLVFNILISSMMDVVDGWFVSRYYEAEDFAIFRYGARELPFSSVLYNSISVAMIPFIVSGESSLSQLKSKATKWMHVLFPVSIVMMFISPVLFTLIYNPGYERSAFIFNIYLLILTSRVLLPQAYNFAKQQHSVIIWSGIIELFCNIILSYFWMQIWGIYGLAMATVVAYFIQKLILMIYNQLKNDIQFSAYIDVKYYLIYCLASVMALFLSFKIFP